MFSFRDNSQFNRAWLQWSAILLAMHFIVALLIVMMLNGKVVNHGLTPIFQFTGMFTLIWPEQPLGSLHFLATKSVFAFAHHDPRSGLNLWTLEYDTYTLFVYIALSLIMGRLLARYRQQAINIPLAALVLCAIGVLFLALSVSYMTVIEHCSGATWVGFVALYGMGFDEFELYTAYQIITAILGIIGLASGLIWSRISKMREFT